MRRVFILALPFAKLAAIYGAGDLLNSVVISGAAMLLATIAPIRNSVATKSALTLAAT
jgi:hypothetical protein